MTENIKTRIHEAKDKFVNYKNHPFRQYQEEAIEYILNSDKKYIFLEAPTGSGKSLCGAVSAICMDGANYCVHSKTLQNQLTTDFPEGKSLFGRANYQCVKDKDQNCDECLLANGIECDKKHICLYEVQKKLVLKSRLRILNYDYLLYECNYSGNFSVNRDPSKWFNIMDEADTIESTLVNFVSLQFTTFGLRRLKLDIAVDNLKKTSKDKGNLISSWMDFCYTAKVKATAIVKMLTEDIEFYVNARGKSIPQEIKNKMKERMRIIRLIERIDLFMDNANDSWLYDNSQADKYIFRPLWMNEALADKFLWSHGDKWLLMSATFLPLHIECKRLGIPLDETDYKVIPSNFPATRRPVHIEPVANLTGKTMQEETPKLIKRIHSIINERPNVKGLIHAVSFKLANAIYDGVDSDRLIIHDSSNRQDVLDEFMESTEPLILISPSLERGVSLNKDLCRFIIVAKSPFLYLGDRIVSERVYGSRIGKEWYAATMLSTVLQMCGRGMRSADDYCETFILDAQFDRVFQQKPSYLPEWWKEAIAW